jgi:hypothetical protein
MQGPLCADSTVQLLGDVHLVHTLQAVCHRQAALLSERCAAQELLAGKAAAASICDW